ncbi:MAG: proline-rich domain-containing protein [Stackebrandtia sp.]
MTYPPPQGGYDPYGQQPDSGWPQQPTTGVPASPGPYGQPAYAQPVYAAPGFPSAPAQPPGERPTGVTAAAMLMVTAAAILVVAGVATLIAMVSASDGLSEIGGMEDTATTFKAIGIGISVVYLIVGLGVIGLALGVLRGRGWARIVTFCVYGIFLGCGLCSGIAALTSLDSGAAGAEAMGGALFSVMMVVLVLIEIITVVLLALPASNEWFKAVSRAKAAGPA